MLKNSKRPFGEILITEGILDREQIESALETQKESGYPIGEILLKQGLISENEIVRALSIQYQLPFIRPSCYELRPDLLDLFEPKILLKHRIVPLDRIGSCAIVAIGSIPPEELQRQIAQTLDAEVFFYFAPITDVENVLRNHFPYSQEDVVLIEAQRRPGATPPKPKTPVFDGLEASSWESIFDEADKNV